MANLIETEITSTKPELTATELVVHDTGDFAMLFDTARFNQSWRVAQAFATSGLVPDHFKNNTAGVFVVLHMATRMQLDPFMCLQKVYMVHGRPGMEAQLIIALVNARGPFQGPIQWRFDGEGSNRSCTAYATHAKTGELCEATVTWGMVESEGWSKKSGSKWLTLESLMFRYRSATFLARLYCPEVILGLSTADELEDTAITLDSGVTISHKPRATLPEAPEVDPAAVEEFMLLVGDQTVEESVYAAVENYVAQIAKVNKQTVEAVKAQAGTPENFPAFWKSFLVWHKKETKSKPPKPTGEVITSGPVSGEGENKEVKPEAATETQNENESQGPDVTELWASLEAKGWPRAKVMVKFAHNWGTWTEEQKAKALADLLAAWE